MGWQTNMVDDSEEWTSTATGLLWKIARTPNGNWFASYDGTPLRIDHGGPRGAVRLLAVGRMTWWRTKERAREGCELYDAAIAKGAERVGG